MAISPTTDYDVVIVGAGISGVNAAQRLQTELPGYTYTILEARAAMGGTWDLFRYPGIRSDSDLHTFGFPWQPWPYSRSIADGESIRNYIKDAAAQYGIDKHVRFYHKLMAADWSSKNQLWSLNVDAAGDQLTLRSKFVIFGSGYYNYEEPLKAVIPGIDNFEGTKIHPQFWPEHLDYKDKKIVIIGSGATAVTLLPNLTEKAAKVTMLQRSPSYVLSEPAVDQVGEWMKKYFPRWMASTLIRWKFLVIPWLFFQFCRAFPHAAIRIINSETEKQLPKSIPRDPNFKPSYNPWEQRLCVSPDGDFYEALRQGKGDVVTDTIKTVTKTGILTSKGKILDADIIITATGLKIQLAGGAKLSVDGAPIDIPKKFIWKGAMLQDIPNAIVMLGYTNASWTLGAEATAQHVCRLLKYMESRGFTSATPKVAAGSQLKAQSILNLKSTYIVEAKGSLPKAGDSGPWKPRTNYFNDMWKAKYGSLTNGLEFVGSSRKDK
ncbi:hypothetical protein PVAG01_04744 [Phlyctema vagabunda]|uniref:Uncharacterized protein n=1 Tax=Phlyctema vagabunda TaxID=108571 RepID=A0ABR4PI27_9HELO